MYQSKKTTLAEGRSHKYTLFNQSAQLSFAEFLSLLQQDEEFRSFFIDLLSRISFRAYHWETPPLTSSNTDRPFEFVATRTPGIDLSPDPGPFRQYFSAQDTSNNIAVFENLGKDALLVAPAPLGKGRNYSHIGVFTDEAPSEQQHALWQTVGRVVEDEVTEEPLWLNTAGGGVAWLHVRLDSRPKYYRHHPYREAT